MEVEKILQDKREDDAAHLKINLLQIHKFVHSRFYIMGPRLKFNWSKICVVLKV